MTLTETASEMDHLNEEQRDCLENCFEASETSEWCADQCIGEEGMDKCARLCRDVADATALHARFMARNSGYSTQFARVCAGLCEEAAAECERHDDHHCQKTAEVLRECVESCRTMIGS